MRTKTITLYSFDELSEEGKKKAIENLYDLNIMHDWWESTYEDAERIGLKISSFDIDRGNYCQGEFIKEAEKVASLILENHGEECETYKTAKTFIDEYKPKKEKFESENEGFYFEHENEGADLQSEFLKSLLEDYRIILQKEYEYLTSEEQIIESIKANEYTFTENGKLENE